MEVTLSTGRKLNIEALNVTQTVETFRLTRSIPKPGADVMEIMSFLVTSQRQVIGWAMENAGLDPESIKKTIGGMRLDEMTEVLDQIRYLTMLTQGSASRQVQ